MKAERIYSWELNLKNEPEDPPKVCPSCSGTYIKRYSPYNDPILEPEVHHDTSFVYICRDCFDIVKIHRGKVYMTPKGKDDLPF
jgi:hypothetical protein